MGHCVTKWAGLERCETRIDGFWLWESVARGSQLLAPELLQSRSLGELGENPLTFEDPIGPFL